MKACKQMVIHLQSTPPHLSKLDEKCEFVLGTSSRSRKFVVSIMKAQVLHKAGTCICKGVVE
jgi:hypothetical protein